MPSDFETVSSVEKAALTEDSLEESGLSTGALILSFAIFLLVALLGGLKVYFANNIYYISKEIHYLQAQKEALKDENAALKQQLENTRFNLLTLEIEEIK